MTTPTAASLLHLIDRAERGSLLAEEAQQLRNGIRALAALARPHQSTLPGDKRTCCGARIGHYPTCPANQPQPTTTEAP